MYTYNKYVLNVKATQYLHTDFVGYIIKAAKKTK